MKNGWSWPGLGLMLSIVIVAAGCANNNKLTGGTFLQNYGELKAVTTPPGAFVYYNQSLPLAGFDRFVISRLMIQYRPDQQAPVAIRDIDKSEQEYRAALAAAMERGGRFKQSSAPGPGVLLIRTAITGTYDAAAVDSQQRRSATIEVEALDSISGKRVFAMVDLNAGDTSAGSTGTQQVFTAWADRLRAALDAAPVAAK